MTGNCSNETATMTDCPQLIFPHNKTTLTTCAPLVFFQGIMNLRLSHCKSL